MFVCCDFLWKLLRNFTINDIYCKFKKNNSSHSLKLTWPLKKGHHPQQERIIFPISQPSINSGICQTRCESFQETPGFSANKWPTTNTFETPFVERSALAASNCIKHWSCPPRAAKKRLVHLSLPGKKAPEKSSPQRWWASTSYKMEYNWVIEDIT